MLGVDRNDQVASNTSRPQSALLALNTPEETIQSRTQSMSSTNSPRHSRTNSLPTIAPHKRQASIQDVSIYDISPHNKLLIPLFMTSRHSLSPCSAWTTSFESTTLLSDYHSFTMYILVIVHSRYPYHYLFRLSKMFIRTHICLFSHQPSFISIIYSTARSLGVPKTLSKSCSK